MTATKTRPTTKTTPAANKIALRDAIAGLNDGRAEAYLELFHPDARLYGFPAGVEDVEALARFHADTAVVFPDASVTLEDVVAEGNRVATRFTWRAGEASGSTLVAHGGAIARFADGKIAECWNLPAELYAIAP